MWANQYWKLLTLNFLRPFHPDLLSAKSSLGGNRQDLGMGLVTMMSFHRAMVHNDIKLWPIVWSLGRTVPCWYECIPVLGDTSSLLVANCSRMILANKVGDRKTWEEEEEEGRNTTSTLQPQQSTVLQLGGLLLYFHGGTIYSTAAVKQWCKHMYLHAHLVSHFEKQVLTVPAAGRQVPRREGSLGEWQWLGTTELVNV